MCLKGDWSPPWPFLVQTTQNKEAEVGSVCKGACCTSKKTRVLIPSTHLKKRSCMWWSVPLILMLQRLRQEDLWLTGQLLQLYQRAPGSVRNCLNNNNKKRSWRMIRHTGVAHMCIFIHTHAYTMTHACTSHTHLHAYSSMYVCMYTHSRLEKWLSR